MTARQLAVQLLFSMEINRLTPDDAFTLFFEEEHYQSLKEEDLVFKDFPDDVQMAYIREIVEKTYRNLEEIDAVIERYSHKPVFVFKRILVCLDHCPEKMTASLVNEVFRAITQKRL